MNSNQSLLVSVPGWISSFSTWQRPDSGSVEPTLTQQGSEPTPTWTSSRRFSPSTASPRSPTRPRKTRSEDQTPVLLKTQTRIWRPSPSQTQRPLDPVPGRPGWHWHVIYCSFNSFSFVYFYFFKCEHVLFLNSLDFTYFSAFGSNENKTKFVCSMFRLWTGSLHRCIIISLIHNHYINTWAALIHSLSTSNNGCFDFRSD